mmetsp:Transcript_39683/g.60802  ORF Transcript_39683/g.60802 Transcript_39683/m.60802 type:complete len:260 (-) Transcript_39683:246-1025(-)
MRVHRLLVDLLGLVAQEPLRVELGVVLRAGSLVATGIDLHNSIDEFLVLVHFVELVSLEDEFTHLLSSHGVSELEPVDLSLDILPDLAISDLIRVVLLLSSGEINTFFTFAEGVHQFLVVLVNRGGLMSEHSGVGLAVGVNTIDLLRQARDVLLISALQKRALEDHLISVEHGLSSSVVSAQLLASELEDGGVGVQVISQLFNREDGLIDFSLERRLHVIDSHLKGLGLGELFFLGVDEFVGESLEFINNRSINFGSLE